MPNILSAPLRGSAYFKETINTQYSTVQRRARTRPGVPGSRNSFKVRFGYPGVPMVLERLLRRVTVLQLPKRPLVDDVRVSSVVE
jgi:hypothetical protein